MFELSYESYSLISYNRIFVIRPLAVFLIPGVQMCSKLTGNGTESVSSAMRFVIPRSDRIKQRVCISNPVWHPANCRRLDMMDFEMCVMMPLAGRRKTLQRVNFLFCII